MSHKIGPWGKKYLLHIVRDEVITDPRKRAKVEAKEKVTAKSAKAYRKRYSMHKSMTLTTSGGGTLLDGSKPLSSAKLNDKLFVVSHGETHSIGGFSYDQFSEALKDGGLKKMGLIAFKACLIGSGNFLDNLKVVVSSYAEVGYYVGYKARTSTITRSLLSLEKFGKFSEVLETESDWWMLGYKAPDRERVKVVEGNAASKVSYNR